MLYNQIKEALDKMKSTGTYDTLNISVVEFEHFLTELGKLEKALEYYSQGNDWDFGATAREVLHGTIDTSGEAKESEGS